MDRVLIIDDDRFVQNVIQKALFKSYETRTADDGKLGLALAEKWQPNIILLDVEMPGQNGYEVCDALKHNAATAQIPIVFLSSHSSLRERMLGFEMGADDYLVKPCSQELLQTKLQKITDIYRERVELKNTILSVESTALEAMSTSFELGKAVRFVERSYGFGSIEKLGNALVEVMASLNLSAGIMLKRRSETCFFGASQNAVKPLEKELMILLHGESRFKDFGCRTQINYPHVALLVKNMPLEDRSRYGRIKDTLPFILGAADAKVRMLDAEHALMEQNRELANSVRNAQLTLADVSNILIKNQRSVGEIMLELTAELSLQMCRMGFDGDQEEFINKNVDRASHKLTACLKEGSIVESTLIGIVELLRQMNEEQARIIHETLSVELNNEDEAVANDVELF